MRLISKTLLVVLPFLTFGSTVDAQGLETWASRDFPSREPSSLNDVAYGAGRFVVVGRETNAAGLQIRLVLSSTDGVSWQRVEPGVEETLLGIVYGNGQFVSVGAKGRVLTSPDGLQWHKQPIETLNDLNGVTYGGGQYIAVGEGGAILRSADGTNWAPRLLGNVELAAAAYGNGHFVIAGGDSTAVILESADGVRWNRPYLGDSYREMRGVAYGNGVFVAVGDRENILTSSDTITWQTRRTGAQTLRWVIFAEGRFLAVGGPNSGPAVVLSSPDGIDWTSHDLSAATGVTLLRAAAYGQGTFLVVGDHGIAQSDIVTSSVRLGVNYNSNAEVEIFGPLGWSVTIESGTDINAPWQVRTNVTISNWPQSWIDSGPQAGRRFYRARTPE
jgi:hypothetical protein